MFSATAECPYCQMCVMSFGHCNMSVLTGTSFLHSECGITCMSRVYKIAVSHLLSTCNLAVMGLAGSRHAAAPSVNAGVNTHRMRKVVSNCFQDFNDSKHSFDEHVHAYWQCTHNNDLDNTSNNYMQHSTKRVLWIMVDNWTVGLMKLVTNGAQYCCI